MHSPKPHLLYIARETILFGKPHGDNAALNRFCTTGKFPLRSTTFIYVSIVSIYSQVHSKILGREMYADFGQA